MSENKFVIIATEGLTTNLLCEELSRHGILEAVILEERETARVKIKRRLKRLPLLNVLGQLSFLIFLAPVLSVLAKSRIRHIIAKAGYKNDGCDPEKIIRIKSVNDLKTIDIISQYNPDFVFLNGTRIVHRTILEKITVPVMNIHVGITPQYRGIHGGYWALYHKDAENFGVTFHEVDAGVDTGKILAQQYLKATPKDTFATYPVLQFVAGLKLVESYFKWGQKSIPERSDDPGKQYYHPGFFQYLFNRWFRGIR